MSEPVSMRRITRQEIKAVIGRYDLWYQNIHFGWLLDTHSSVQAYAKRFVKRLLQVRLSQEHIMLKCFPGVAQQRIIDVGCNAGLYSVEASCRGASHVLGTDKNPRAIEQAELVADVFRRTGRPLGEINFRAIDINDNLDLLNDRDMLFACCVLYHLGPLDAFVEAIRSSSNIHTMVLQGNTVRMGKIGEKNRPGVLGYEPENKTWGNIVSDVNGMGDFAKRCGFHVSMVFFRQSQFPLVTCQRN